MAVTNLGAAALVRAWVGRAGPPGAVIDRIGKHYDINCDSSHFAQQLYTVAKHDLFGFMKAQDASHYHRLMNYGLEKDIRYCLTPDGANVLPWYDGLRLVRHTV